MIFIDCKATALCCGFQNRLSLSRTLVTLDLSNFTRQGVKRKVDTLGSLIYTGLPALFHSTAG